jgi:zinc transporter ZupT
MVLLTTGELFVCMYVAVVVVPLVFSQTTCCSMIGLSVCKKNRFAPFFALLTNSSLSLSLSLSLSRCLSFSLSFLFLFFFLFLFLFFFVHSHHHHHRYRHHHRRRRRRRRCRRRYSLLSIALILLLRETEKRKIFVCRLLHNKQQAPTESGVVAVLYRTTLF